MMWCSETDLPTPLRPRMQTVSPGITSKLTWSSTQLSPKDLQTSLNSTYGPEFSLAAMFGRFSSVLDGSRVFVLHAAWLGLLQILRRIQIAKHFLRKAPPFISSFVDHPGLHLSEQCVNLVLALAAATRSATSAKPCR